ncbi:MAG: hypothetical protein EBV00_07170, partial [Burkholderiaceae bacterium]|nr:hypothetical protein [Burkholderiaceae bacterium]
MNRDAFEKGLKTRREVLGAEYVDQAIRNADDFNLPLQELVTEYCWNEKIHVYTYDIFRERIG